MPEPMPNMDAYELEVLEAFEQGKLRSLATQAEVARFQAAACTTAIKRDETANPVHPSNRSA